MSSGLQSGCSDAFATYCPEGTFYAATGTKTAVITCTPCGVNTYSATFTYVSGGIKSGCGPKSSTCPAKGMYYALAATATSDNL